MIRRSRSLILGVAASAAALLLAACSAPVQAGASSASQAAAPAPSASASMALPTPRATPTVDPTDALNAMTVLPADFPPTIPLIEGDILTGSATSTGWEVWISSEDPISDYGDAASSLEDAGFTAQADQSIDGSAGGVFVDDRYTVTVSAGSDAKYQDAVGYQIVKQ